MSLIRTKKKDNEEAFLKMLAELKKMLCKNNQKDILKKLIANLRKT